MIFYTNRFIPDGAAGCARGPFVFIRPEKQGDIGLLEHEKTHRMQWWLTLGMHSFLYLLVRPYRLWAEAMAYRVQRRYPRADGTYLSLDDAVRKLMWVKYDLRLTEDEARKWLA